MCDEGNAAATDQNDQQSGRPDFLILSNQVITMEDPYVHKGSRQYLLGVDAGGYGRDVTRAACDGANTAGVFVYDDR